MSDLDRVNTIVKTTNTTDFRIQSYNSVNLIITGSFDFSYYHEVEIEFREVSYISLSTDFFYPEFRLANGKEIKALENIVRLDKEELLYCIKAENGTSLEKLPFYIVAEGVTVREGMVFYFENENLQEGERIADWVKRKD